MSRLDATARRLLGSAYPRAKGEWSHLVAYRTWRTSRDRQAIAAIADHLGGIVQRGPLAGLRYPRTVFPFAPRLPGKLLAQYEAELAPTFARLIDHGFDTFVDVGSSEGYYAVGFALKSPGTRVHAFDENDLARRLCRLLARANRVADRVTVGGYCEHDDLRRLAAQGEVCVLSDCEGCELQLLDPVAAPELARCTIVVELHEDEHAGLTDTVLGRFRDTHRVEVIDSRPRDRAEVEPLLRGLDLDPADLERLLFERPHAMQWGVLTPLPSARVA